MVSYTSSRLPSVCPSGSNQLVGLCTTTGTFFPPESVLLPKSSMKLPVVKLRSTPQSEVLLRRGLSFVHALSGGSSLSREHSLFLSVPLLRKLAAALAWLRLASLLATSPDLLGRG